MAKKPEYKKQKQHCTKFNKDFGNSYTHKKKNFKKRCFPWDEEEKENIVPSAQVAQW